MRPIQPREARQFCRPTKCRCQLWGLGFGGRGGHEWHWSSCSLCGDKNWTVRRMGTKAQRLWLVAQPITARLRVLGWIIPSSAHHTSHLQSQGPASVIFLVFKGDAASKGPLKFVTALQESSLQSPSWASVTNGRHLPQGRMRPSNPQKVSPGFQRSWQCPGRHPLPPSPLLYW